MLGTIALLLVNSQAKTFSVMPADRLIPLLGDSFGERWKISGDVAKNTLFVFPSKDKADAVRENLADVLHGSWIENNGTWTLMRTQSQFLTELEERNSSRRESLVDARKEWTRQAQSSISPPDVLMRQYESTLQDVLRGDQQAVVETSRLIMTGEGHPFTTFAYRALELIPTEELTKLNTEEVLVFSTRARGKERPLEAGELLTQISKYEAQYRRELALSSERLQLNARKGLDLRTKLAPKTDSIHRIVITASYSVQSVLNLRVIFVDKEGWVASTTNVHVRRKVKPLPDDLWTSVNLKITPKMKQFWSYFGETNTADKSLNSELFNVNQVDPFEWCYGSLLRQIAEKSEKSIYAIVPEHLSPALNDYWGGSGQSKWTDSTNLLVYLHNTGWCEVREESNKWLIHPGSRIENESNFCSRSIFSELVGEFRKYGRLRPGMVAKYAVNQLSDISMDGWDREMIEMTQIVPQFEVFNRFLRLGFLTWGAANQNSDANSAGNYVVTSTTAGPALWKRIVRELSGPIGLRTAFPASRNSESEIENISGWVLSETFPDGPPANFGIWTQVLNQPVLLLRVGQNGNFVGAVPRHESSINNFEHPEFYYAITSGEVLSFGVGDPDSQSTVLAFGAIPKDVKWVKSNQLPEDWQQWMAGITERYRQMYPVVQPGTKPP